MQFPKEILVVTLFLLGGCQEGATDRASTKGPERKLRDLPGEARTAFDTLANADDFLLLSLDGNISFGERGKQREGAFHGWPILGETHLNDPDKRQQLLTALENGVRENVTDRAAACFDPRHGIRAKLSDSTTIEWVICFECLQIRVHHVGRLSTFTTTESPASAFNQILAEAGVKLAPAP